MSAAERRRPIKLRAARMIRPLLILLLAVVVVVIGVYLVRRIRQVPSPPTGPKAIVEKKVDRKEKIRVSETHGEKGLIEASGDLNTSVDEKTYRLEGGVEVIDHGRKGGREIKMNGDVLTYDQEMLHFFLRGNVRIHFKDVTMSGPEFEYDRTGDLMRTSGGAAVEAPAFNGTAQKLLFFVKDEELFLEDHLQFSVRLRLPTPEPLILSGDKLTYGFVRRRGNVEGNVGIAHGLSRGTADHVYFEQFEKVENLRVLQLQGNVKLRIEEERAAAGKAAAAKPAPAPAPEAPESSISREFRLDQSRRQEIVSDDVKLQAFMNLPILHIVECRGRSAIKFFFDSGEATEIRGESVDLSFSKEGVLREIKAADAARIAGLDKTGVAGRVIEGASLVLDAEAGVLHVASGAGRPARIASAQSDISGDALSIMIKLDDFEMKGGVQMSLRASQKDAADKGFFSTERPVFAKSGWMRYSDRLKRFLLWEQVRTWQDQKVLSAQEIILAEDMTDMTCKGSVQSVFPHKTKEGEPERRVEISADGMRYDPKTRQVIYENNVQLKSGAAVLTCGMITVDPGEGGGEIHSMHAVKGTAKALIVVMNAREGTGEIADYDVQKDTIVLTGKPELKEKDKGTVRGEKLTFHLGDGTIRVETRDQERPVPVIKS